MAYLRWSNSPFYVFDHVTDGPPILAIWTMTDMGVYEQHDVEELRDALNEWLQDIREDLRRKEASANSVENDTTT